MDISALALQTNQVGSRDNGVKVTVATHDWSKLALVYKSRANGQSALMAKPSNLLRNLGLYRFANMPLAFYLNDIHRLTRLDEQVDLEAPALAKITPFPLFVWNGGKNRNAIQMKRLHEIPKVVYDKVLELEPKNGIPSRQRLKRIK